MATSLIPGDEAKWLQPAGNFQALADQISMGTQPQKMSPDLSNHLIMEQGGKHLTAKTWLELQIQESGALFLNQSPEFQLSRLSSIC